MCPIAAESTNSKSRSKKKINKAIQVSEDGLIFLFNFFLERDFEFFDSAAIGHIIDSFLG